MVAPPAVVVRNVDAVDCVDFSGKTTYHDFRDDLVRDGVAVVKNAIPAQRAAYYVERMQSYLESFGLGYKRDDPSTFNEAHLPVINEKGMLMHYKAPHEDFAWQLRSEPGIKGAYATVYGTDDLIVSFDSWNVTLPGRKDNGENKPWPHQDQDPKTTGMRSVQGIANLLPNGDDDGGLIVMKGAHHLWDEFHKEHENEEDKIWAWTNEWYGLTENGVAWFRARGFEFTKVNAGPGDLILWDSRVPHFNKSPTSDRMRLCQYICMSPAYTATQEELLIKKQAFENFVGTTHWPQALQLNHLPCIRQDGKPCPYERSAPVNPPEPTPEILRLVGIPYITSASTVKVSA